MASCNDSVISGDSNESVALADEELFLSGEYSDITIKCGDKSWALHRNILGTRSDYFYDLFRDAQAQNRRLPRTHTFRGCDPDAVGFVLEWIYRREHQDLHDNARLSIKVLLERWATAEYIALPRLVGDLKAKAASTWIRYLNGVQQHGPATPQHIIAGMANAVQYAYDRGYAEQKEMLVEGAQFFGIDRLRSLRELRVLAGVGSFAQDIMTHEYTGVWY
ncbi:hypothetical protein F5Y18DRAFT_434285 [Xylariaceae sp. FL1019]|nr:hypothetical protein F5Y18DRAFT_434285 [Xylariaceae sp. FL1019]